MKTILAALLLNVIAAAAAEHRRVPVGRLQPARLDGVRVDGCQDALDGPPGEGRDDFQPGLRDVAELRTKVDISRCFVDRCIQRYVGGTCTVEEAAMAKWWTTDLLCEITDAGVQFHGGYGYTKEYPIGQAWIDARIGKIYAGTNEIMKELIGKTMGL